MDDLDRYIAEQMKDTAFRAEHERTRLEFALTELLISSRMEQDLTQKELADRSGVPQSNISRIEKGQAIPSLMTLDKIARALGKEVRVSFV